MKLFAQIRKVDEEKRLVFGRLADETVDKSDEAMDYLASKPHFEKWSADVAKDTDGKSVGNLRAMHGKVAAGKFVKIDFDDGAKTIDVCAKVVDDGEWKKVLEGVYTGFSIGGDYGAKKVEKMDGRNVTRYVAIPNEGSLVDRPCNGSAKFFEVQKADGSLRKVEFAKATDDQVVGTEADVAELSKLMDDKKLTVRDVIAKISTESAAAATPGNAAAAAPGATATQEVAKAQETKTPEQLKKLEQRTLRKSMYGCSALAQTIASLQSLQSSAAYEAYSSGDDSGIAAKLRACIAMCGGVLVDMVQAEIAEPDADSVVMELAEKAGALAKYEGDPLVDLLKAEGVLAKAGARHSAADAARLKSIHDAAVGMGAECKGAAKADEAGELAKVETAKLQKAELEKAEGERLAKLVADAVAPLQKVVDAQAATIKEQGEQLTKIAAQPAAPTVSLRALSKSDDVGHAGAKPASETVAPVIDGHGETHEAASLIKSLHASGGTPLVRPLSKQA